MTKSRSTVLPWVMRFFALTCFGCSPNSSPAAAPTSPAASRAREVPGYTLDPSFPNGGGVSFNTVSWVERNPNTKLIYVLQRSTPPVSAWTTSGALVSTWATHALGDPHSLSFHANADASTSVWITDMAPPLLAGKGYGHCLKQFTLTGSPTSTIGTCAEDSGGTGVSPVQFDEVTDIAWGRQGALLVSDGDLHGLNNRVLELDPAGAVLANWSAPGDQPGSGPGQFNLPHALVVDRCERVWIADALNHRVQVLGTDGAYRGSLTSFGELGVYALEFGASFSVPAEAVLFVGASPTTGGGTGTVSLFAVPMNCAQLDIAALSPFAQFEVPIPASTSMTLLHSLTVDPETWDVYVAVLGGELPPQKWVASWLGKPRPSAH